MTWVTIANLVTAFSFVLLGIGLVGRHFAARQEARQSSVSGNASTSD